MYKWYERFLLLAEHIAEWSKDPSTKVGSVIVRPNRTIASLGYNGFVRGIADTPEDYANREVKLAKIVHAELNAILNAREPLTGYTIYVSAFIPCVECSKSIIQSGLGTVVIPDIAVPERWVTSCNVSSSMFWEAKVDVIKVPKP